MMSVAQGGPDIWKWIACTLATILLSLMGVILGAEARFITRAEFRVELEALRHMHGAQNDSVQRELNQIHATLSAIRGDIQALKR